MRRKLLAGVFLLVLGCQQAPTWTEFESTQGGFAVLLPGTPTEHNRTAKTASGSIDAHMFLVDHGDVAYMVAYSDYPDTMLEERTPKLILDGARDGAVAHAKGKLLSESIVSINEHQGREVHIERVGGKVTITARIFLVGRRLYQVMVLMPKDKASSKDVKKFLDSFRIQPQPPQPES